MANANVNKTQQGSMSATMQTYYDRKMIMDMKPKLVHYEYGQKRPLPLNAGKQVQFRKWTPFAAQTGALVEGVVPDGQALSLTEVSASIEQYGGYVAVSDLLDMTALDPVVNDSVELMADQGALTIDTLTREQLVRGTNVLYAAGPDGLPAAGRAALTPGHRLTSTELRKAVRLLKKNKAPQFMRAGKGYYVAIVGPDSVYDLQSDQTWQDVGKYQESEQIFSGEIGRLFGVIVIETSEAHFFRAESEIVTGHATFTSAAANAYAPGAPSLLVTAQGLNAAQLAALEGAHVVVRGERVRIASAAAHATPANGTVLTLQHPLSGGAGDYNGLTVYPDGGGAEGGDVAATLVIGKDAYGVVDLEGKNVRAIIKNRGSAGTADPLDQISTVGWKVAGFAVKILQDAWLVRVEHGVSA
ncbi:MAG: N4-gp56 family major capsid protein [Christensenellaceae bacterium]|nr:N4-gp56 family major capsid protein [Christensenellaceae bacterium]MEA5065909.1 N4-gp56 family major capsid protein [Eubacteriales bacterium]MEA5067790.1 N4-gp56 family major capsid protein [Christensenellaceae bacterium]